MGRTDQESCTVSARNLELEYPALEVPLLAKLPVFEVDYSLLQVGLVEIGEASCAGWC